MAATSRISPTYQPMFPYEKFNAMQSTVIDDVLFGDKNIVICAPTGSGKTVVLELALIRALENIPNRKRPSVVYLSPLKSLCQERFEDWKGKGEKVGFVADQLTGDNDDNINSEIDILNSCDLLCSTPEKFDWLLRRFRHLFENVRLMLIDEVHTISEENRGPTLEALITRLKTFKSTNGIPPPRFVAVSATIPNVADIGLWFGGNYQVFSFGDEHRAVPLDKVVIGYDAGNAFTFDKALNAELSKIIQEFSDGKSVLVFCMSRKSTESSAASCASGLRLPPSKDPEVIKAAGQLQEKQLASFVLRGVAFHHAGLCQADRQLIESLFLAGKVLVLCSTSTLAIGVNLPAHLVIIKTTQFCTGLMGAPEELSDTTFLQMIGRAGRPQFDTFGRAVILTRYETEQRYRSLLASGTKIESHLFRRIGEQLNAELNLKSISSIATAVNWIKQTFLFVRLGKNPQFYQQKSECGPVSNVDRFLTNSVMSAINDMSENNLITFTANGFPELKPTGYGRLMARQCMSLETMQLIMDKSASKDVSLSDIIDVVTVCSDLAQTVLRNDEVDELEHLNTFIKYPLNGVSGKEAKISILLQAAIGCVKLENQAYDAEARRIQRVAYRVAACLLDTIHLRGNPSFNTLVNASLFFRAMRTEIWHDSPFLSKQIRGIGIVYSGMLAAAGLTTFESIAAASEKTIEDVCNRLPPFGATIKQEASSVPKYSIAVSQLPSDVIGSALLLITIKLLNAEKIAEHSIRSLSHKLIVLAGNVKGNILYDYWRIDDKKLISSGGQWQKEVTVNKSPVCVQLLSLELVGCDVTVEFKPKIKRGSRKQQADNKQTPLAHRTNNLNDGSHSAAKKRPLPYISLFEEDDDDDLESSQPKQIENATVGVKVAKVQLKHSIESLLA